LPPFQPRVRQALHSSSRLPAGQPPEQQVQGPQSRFRNHCLRARHGRSRRQLRANPCQSQKDHQR
jgi:hypothetical protein